ncbi:MAG: lipid A biosynthesis (KDO)2-(lauroyl)-lipid IVA acyltransferase [Tannerella sp.]|nr:lipid A biosynthesis (KDO)2-(lauroyl)-lipid IVA acyltransferase [Tannerella sp.]
MNKPKRQWQGVTGGRAFGQKAMKIMFRILDVRIGYAIMALVVPFYMLFARKGYMAIYLYFRRQHLYSSLKAFRKTYVNHFRFGQMILDRFAVYAGQKSFRLDNPDNEVFQEMVHSKRGCIIANSHVGNPELCGYLLSQQTKRINSLIYGGEAKEVQRNRSAILTDNNVRLIDVGEDMSHIFVINQALTDGEMISIACDRSFGSAKTVECDFFNGKADFPVGAFTLARQFDVPVIALFVLKITASMYRIHVCKIPVIEANTKREEIYAMTRSFAEILERIVKKYPEQWFNFYKFWKDENVSLT